MNARNLKSILVAAFLAAVTIYAAPASAATGYFVVSGMQVIAGPYEDLSTCYSMVRAYQQPGGPVLQCAIRAY
jgi:hypothetical protein